MVGYKIIYSFVVGSSTYTSQRAEDAMFGLALRDAASQKIAVVLD
jgi:hypothetical protein